MGGGWAEAMGFESENSDRLWLSFILALAKPNFIRMGNILCRQIVTKSECLIYICRQPITDQNLFGQAREELNMH